MKNLYLRIYATVVVVLLLFAAASGWAFHRHIEQERARAETLFAERMGAQAELIQRSLPGVDASPADQAVALHEWSQRLRLPLALDSSRGERIAASESFLRRQEEGVVRGLAVRLEDGRTLWIMRPGMRRPPGDRLGMDGNGNGNGRWRPGRQPDGSGRTAAVPAVHAARLAGDRSHHRAGVAVRRGGGGRLSGGPPADAQPGVAEAGRRAVRRRPAQPPGGGDRAGRSRCGGHQFQRGRRPGRGARPVAPVAARQRQP